MEHFWTNTVWYLLLGAAAVLQVGYVMLKTEQRRLMLALYIAVSGATYSVEVAIFGFLKSYDYFPMILHHISRLDDGLAGNIFSQFAVSATALLLSFLDLKYRWIIIMALIYGGVEELFLSLGIYQQYWWRTWMTVGGLIFFFSIVRIIYLKTFAGPGRFLKYVLVINAVYVPHVILLTWPIKLLGYPAFNEHIFPDPVISIMVIFSASFILLANTTMVAYFLRLSRRGHAAVISAFYAAYYIAYRSGYIIYETIGMVMLFASAEIWGMYLCVYIFDRLFDRAGKGRPRPLA